MDGGASYGRVVDPEGPRFLTVGRQPRCRMRAPWRSVYRELLPGLAEAYRKRRDLLMPSLVEAGFRCFRPRGAYYVMTDITRFGYADDVAFTNI